MSAAEHAELVPWASWNVTEKLAISGPVSVRNRWLTWSALEDHQKEIDCGEQDSASHQELDGPDVPTLDCNSEVEVADRKLEGAVREDVEYLAHVPELLPVSRLTLIMQVAMLTNRAFRASSSLRSHRCRPLPYTAAVIWKARYMVKMI